MRGLSIPMRSLLAGGCLLAALAAPVPALAASQSVKAPAEDIRAFPCTFPERSLFRFVAPLQVSRRTLCVSGIGSLQLNDRDFSQWVAGRYAGVFNIAKPDGSGVSMSFQPGQSGSLHLSDRIINIRIDRSN